MRWKFTSVVLLFLLFVFGASGCEQNSENAKAPAARIESGAEPAAPPAESCHLVMGWDPWPPYQFRDAHGEITGLDVEIARAAAEAAGCDTELVEAPWMELVGRLRTGDVHLLAGATRTPGREEFAEFTRPYRSESFVVYTYAENEALRNATSLDALLEGETRLGTVAEYYYGAEISAVLDALQRSGRLHEASIAELNYERLEMREIDAFIDDPYVVSSILRNRAGADHVVPTGISIDSEQVAFMLSKAGVDDGSIGRFRDGLETIRSNGRLKEILDTWRNMR